MRISDWSSDVCSSDLHWATTAASALPAQARANMETITCPSMSSSWRGGGCPLPDCRPFLRRRLRVDPLVRGRPALRSEEHTSELQSLMRISYAVFCLKKNTTSSTNQI